MEVAVGTSQGVDNGLKQSQELPNSALTNTSQSGESKGYCGEHQAG